MESTRERNVFQHEAPICYGVDLFTSEKSTNPNRIYVNWSGNFGFGQISFAYDNERKKLSVNNEYLDKEQVKAIFCKIIDNGSYFNDVMIVGKDGKEHRLGEWKKFTTSLIEEESNKVFKQIKAKKLKCLNDGFKNEKFYFLFADAESEEITYEVICDKEQVYWNDNSEESNTSIYFDLYTYSLGDKKQEIKTILGYLQILKNEWRYIEINDNDE